MLHPNVYLKDRLISIVCDICFNLVNPNQKDSSPKQIPKMLGPLPVPSPKYTCHIATQKSQLGWEPHFHAFSNLDQTHLSLRRPNIDWWNVTALPSWLPLTYRSKEFFDRKAWSSRLRHLSKTSFGPEKMLWMDPSHAKSNTFYLRTPWLYGSKVKMIAVLHCQHGFPRPQNLCQCLMTLYK